MKNILTILVLFLANNVTYSQTDTTVTYYTFNGVECKKRKATYLIKTYHLEDGRFGVHKFYSTGTPIEYYVFKNDSALIKEGPYKKFSSSGYLKIEGQYVNNLREGEWKFYESRNMLSSKGAYKADLKDGLWEYYDYGDNLKAKGSYSNGLKNGLWEQYTDENQLKSKGTYKLGIKDGPWEFYDQNGLLQKKCDYTDGQLNGYYARWKDGQLLEEGRFEDFKEIGEWIGWYSNGAMEYKGSFGADGKHIGEWFFYHENGEIAIHKTYTKGEAPKTIRYDTEGNETEFAGTEYLDPVFPGGEVAMSQFIIDHIEYPEIARKAGEQGIVYIQFTVMRNGSLENIRVIKGSSESLNAEALRVAYLMPNWEPGMRSGLKTNTEYTLPIHFRLG